MKLQLVETTTDTRVTHTEVHLMTHTLYVNLRHGRFGRDSAVTILVALSRSAWFKCTRLHVDTISKFFTSLFWSDSLQVSLIHQVNLKTGKSDHLSSMWLRRRFWQSNLWPRPVLQIK